jgi:hypothetical protein
MAPGRIFNDCIPEMLQRLAEFAENADGGRFELAYGAF